MAVVVAVTGRYNDQELKRAQADLAKLQKAGAGAATGLQGAFQKVGASLKTAGAKMSSVGRQATVGMTLPLAGVGFVATRLAGDFEQTMNQMQVAADLSGRELQKMSDLALKMGADTSFSAGEAAEAMLDLAKAGITPAQIKTGALQASMALAATEGMGLSDAATVMANSMSVFGIKAKNAGSVADKLAAGSQASTASVSSLSQALAQVGPGAKNAGLSLTDTVAVLAAFDQAGIKGSDAGTSLKTMLTRLVPSTDKAAGAMRKLGLDFTDADGKIDDISVVAQKLQDKLGPLSQEQRTLALNTIFGSDATRAATVLMKEGVTGIEGYREATEKQGVAQKMADARMKGTAGAIEAMKGSLETAGILIGQTIAPYVTMFAKKIAELANWFGDLDPTIQKIIVAVGAFAAAIGPVLVVLGAIVTGAGAVATAVGAISLGPLIAVVAAIGAAAILVIRNWDTVKAFFLNLWTAVQEQAAAFMGWLRQTFGSGSGVEAFTQKWEEWKNKLGPLLDEVAAMFGALVDLLKTYWGRMITIFRVVAEVLGWIWRKFGDKIMAVVDVVFSVVVNVIKGAFQIVKGIFKVLSSALQGDWKGMWDGIKDILSGAWGVITAYVRVLWDKIGGAFLSGIGKVLGWMADLPGKIKDKLGELAGLLVNMGKDLIQGLINGIKEKLSELWGVVTDITDGIKDKFSSALKFGSPSKVMIQFGTWITEGLAKGIEDGTVKVGEAMRKASSVVLRSAEDIVEAYQDKMMSRLKSVQDTIRSYVDGIKATFTEAGSIGNVFSTEEGAASITDQLKVQVAAATKFARQVKALREQGLNRGAIQQIVGLGATEGSAAASQLLDDKDAISQVNRFQRQLAQAGERTGRYLGDQYYGDKLAQARADAKAANQTSVRVEKGAVVVNFGDGVDKKDRQQLARSVDKAVDQAMKELVRELRSKAS